MTGGVEFSALTAGSVLRLFWSGLHRVALLGPTWRTSRGGAPLTSWPAPSHAPKGSMPLARCPTVTPPFRHRGSLGRNDSVGRCGETWQSGHPFMEGQPRATSATRLPLDRRNYQGFRRPVEQT